MPEIHDKPIQITLTGEQWFTTLAVLTDPRIMDAVKRDAILSDSGLAALRRAKEAMTFHLAHHAGIKTGIRLA